MSSSSGGKIGTREENWEDCSRGREREQEENIGKKMGGKWTKILGGLQEKEEKTPHRGQMPGAQVQLKK